MIFKNNAIQYNGLLINAIQCKWVLNKYNSCKWALNKCNSLEWVKKTTLALHPMVAVPNKSFLHCTLRKYTQKNVSIIGNVF